MQEVSALNKLGLFRFHKEIFTGNIWTCQIIVQFKTDKN